MKGWELIEEGSFEEEPTCKLRVFNLDRSQMRILSRSMTIPRTIVDEVDSLVISLGCFDGNAHLVPLVVNRVGLAVFILHGI